MVSRCFENASCGESGTLTVLQDGGHTVVRIEIPSLASRGSRDPHDFPAGFYRRRRETCDRSPGPTAAVNGRAAISGFSTDPVHVLERLRHADIDVLFLYIQMPGLTGFDLLIDSEPNMPVIFTTALTSTRSMRSP